MVAPVTIVRARAKGGSKFASDLYGNSKEELTYDSYIYKRDGESSGVATSQVESELNDLALEESKASSGGAQAGVSVAFSLQPKARDALGNLAKGSLCWVSLEVDTDAEAIELSERSE